MKNIKSQSMFSPMSTIRHNDANEEEEEEIDQFNKEMQSSKDESSDESDNERRSQPNNEMNKHKKTEHLYCEQGENSFKKEKRKTVNMMIHDFELIYMFSEMSTVKKHWNVGQRRRDCKDYQRI